MDRFKSYSGNGYEERKSQELRSLNNRVDYFKEQKKLHEEQKLNLEKQNNPTVKEKIDALKYTHTQPLNQNHMKLPGNNQFK